MFGNQPSAMIVDFVIAFIAIVVRSGPVDALWIENMNTVLGKSLSSTRSAFCFGSRRTPPGNIDDNKTLCLANGERIKLTSKIAMVFEGTDSLRSRCSSQGWVWRWNSFNRRPCSVRVSSVEDLAVASVRQQNNERFLLFGGPRRVPLPFA